MKTKGISKFQKIRLAVLTFSTIMFPVTFFYFSPVISIGGSTLGIISGSVIVFLVQALSAVFLGRSFCSWLCPAGGIQDHVGRVREKRVRVSRIAWLKWVIWGVWLGMLLFFFFSRGGIKGVDFTFATERGLSTASAEALLSYTAVVSVFFLLSLIFGKRTGCHALCWMAPFMIIGRKSGLALRIPALYIRTRPAVCTGCGRCSDACPMSLDVRALVRTGEITDCNCISCGSCIDVCKNNAAAFAWRRRKDEE